MTWNMVHFDVQLIGGIVLHRGRIAEMATGEGKTLVATLPLYLNALAGRGAHLVTVNDYLARRDAEWMGQLYNFLGLTVGCIQHDQPPDLRREQYALRHHLRHELRVRFRLPARQRHGHDARATGAARLSLRDRRRGRFDPDRRSAHAAHHQRSGHGLDPSIRSAQAAGRSVGAKAEHALQPARQRGEGGLRQETTTRKAAGSCSK